MQPTATEQLEWLWLRFWWVIDFDFVGRGELNCSCKRLIPQNILSSKFACCPQSCPHAVVFTAARFNSLLLDFRPPTSREFSAPKVYWNHTFLAFTLKAT
jgi:hypothetical protein